jgi:hypothetical protein
MMAATLDASGDEIAAGAPLGRIGTLARFRRPRRASVQISPRG